MDRLDTSNTSDTSNKSNKSNNLDPLDKHALVFIETYKKMEEGRSEKLFGENHTKYLDQLYDLFYAIQPRHFMGYCENTCKKPMYWSPVDKGYAAVCDCNEIYWLKTDYV